MRLQSIYDVPSAQRTVAQSQQCSQNRLQKIIVFQKVLLLFFSITIQMNKMPDPSRFFTAQLLVWTQTLVKFFVCFNLILCVLWKWIDGWEMGKWEWNSKQDWVNYYIARSLWLLRISPFNFMITMYKICAKWPEWLKEVKHQLVLSWDQILIDLCL